MKRKDLMALRNPRWETLFSSGNNELEVEIVPSEMPDLTTAKLLGVNNSHIAKEICTNAFINFRGYINEDGSEVPNDLDARLELYSFPQVRKELQSLLEVRNFEAVAGEEIAAND